MDVEDSSKRSNYVSSMRGRLWHYRLRIKLIFVRSSLPYLFLSLLPLSSISYLPLNEARMMPWLWFCCVYGQRRCIRLKDCKICNMTVPKQSLARTLPFRLLHRQDEWLRDGFPHGGSGAHRLRSVPAPPPSDEPQGSGVSRQDRHHQDSRYAYGPNGTNGQGWSQRVGHDMNDVRRFPKEIVMWRGSQDRLGLSESRGKKCCVTEAESSEVKWVTSDRSSIYLSGRFEIMLTVVGHLLF